ncbi:hypothetical protein [Streptodolium elevatio]|uniref:Uncharacterized protein n=1 Tax=Streptodolium elevatio TaxID=3157996 RepID=A0ABV3DGT8_9ACTN
MSVESDHPEFPYEEPPHGITYRQRPWDGVLVMVDGLPFNAGDTITFDVTVCSDADGQVVAATAQGVVRLMARTTTVSYTIPWNGVLDAVAEGSIVASYTHTPAGGGEPATSESAIVGYSRRQSGGCPSAAR